MFGQGIPVGGEHSQIRGQVNGNGRLCRKLAEGFNVGDEVGWSDVCVGIHRQIDGAVAGVPTEKFIRA